MNANRKTLDAGKSMGVYIFICSLYKNMFYSLIYTKTILLNGK